MRKYVFVILILFLSAVCQAEVKVFGDGEPLTFFNNSQFISFVASPSMSESVTYVLWTADGDPGQTIITDGAGVLSFADVNAVAGTHDILSVTHDDAIGAMVTKGDIIYGNATPKWADLPIGAQGDYLRVDGGLPDWQATTSITTLGTIVTGVWNATAIDISDYTTLTVTAPITLTDDDVGITIAKDIVAGVGLSGGENDVLPGADADTTLTFDATELDALTWDAGSLASIAWSWDLSAGDPTITFGNDLITVSNSLTVATGKNITLGTTQWNSADEMDGTKIKDADYGDVDVSAGGVWTVSSVQPGSIDISDDTNLTVTAPITLTDDDVGITVLKDIVAGVGLSGGENDVLPGADADTTLTFAPTEVSGNQTWGDGSTDTIVWTWDRATGTDPTMTFGDDLITIAGALQVDTINIDDSIIESSTSLLVQATNGGLAIFATEDVTATGVSVLGSLLYGGASANNNAGNTEDGGPVEIRAGVSGDATGGGNDSGKGGSILLNAADAGTSDATRGVGGSIIGVVGLGSTDGIFDFTGDMELVGNLTITGDVDLTGDYDQLGIMTLTNTNSNTNTWIFKATGADGLQASDGGQGDDFLAITGAGTRGGRSGQFEFTTQPNPDDGIYGNMYLLKNGGNVRIGGTATPSALVDIDSANTTTLIDIDATGLAENDFAMDITSNESCLKLLSSNERCALIQATSGNAIQAITTTGDAINATATAGGLAALLAINVANASSILPIVNITRRTTGSAANGIGAGLDFKVESASPPGATETTGSIDSVLTDVTAGAEVSDMRFRVRDGLNGEELKFLINATGIEIGGSQAGIDPLVTWAANGTDGTMQWRESEDEFRISGNDAINYTAIEADGTIELHGTATVFDDIRTPLTAIRITGPGGTTPPDEVLYKGSVILAFGGAGTDDEKAFFSIQMPHWYKEGSDIVPHLHWTPEDNTAGNVRWILTYSWANIDATFPAETTDAIEVPADTTTDKHQRDVFSTITGTGKTISSMILCSIQREDSDPNDTFNNKDAYLLEIDFHAEKDTMGSRTIADSK